MDPELDNDHSHELSGVEADSSQPMLGTASAWSNVHNPTGCPEQRQPYMEWSTVNPAATLDLSMTFPTASGTASGHQPSLESLGLFPLIASTAADNLSWQDQLGSQSCQCRAGLAQLIPNARAALQESRLDEVFRVTSDIIQRCEGIAGCGTCKVNCTDLICIMAVFQEADACFEYVATGDIAGPINVSFGSYAVETGSDEDVQEWRTMLVSQLVRRANRLMDSISARGQEMLAKLDPGCRLGRVNIDYLEAVIQNSRENLRHAMEGLEHSGRTEQKM